MIAPMDAIHATTVNVVSPLTYKIPTSLHKGVKALCWIHAIWRGSRTARAGRDAPSFLSYIAGVGLNLSYGDKRGVKIAAQVVLVALRIVECVENYVSMQVTYNALVNELKGYAIAPMKMSWKKPGKCVFLTPSVHHTIFSMATLKWYRTKQVSYLIVKIFYHLFDLSMCIYDASRAMSIDNDHVDDNINEIFLNGKDIWKKLTHDLPYLEQQLREHSKVIDTLMSNVSNTPIRTSHLLKLCTVTVAVKDGFNETVDAVKSSLIKGVDKVVKVTNQAAAYLSNADYVDPNERYIDERKISAPHWIG